MRRARRPLGRRVVRLLAVGFGLLLLLVALTLGTAVMSAMGALRALQAVGFAVTSIREALTPFAKGDAVLLPGAIWIVTARA